MDDLDRLYDRLATNVREGFPHLLERTFRLGDISEHLVPYRTNRRELQFDSARQYEVALMRLASGEKGYLKVEPTVADALRRALASPEPDAAVLRDHALATVALREATPNGSPLPSAAVAEPARPAAPEATAQAEPTAEPPMEPSAPTPLPPEPSISAMPVSSPAAEAPPPMRRPTEEEGRPGPTAIGGPCRYCGQPLPEGRPVTYCPYCGQNVTVRHCPACSTELEVGWQYCITCGRAMDDVALHTGQQ